MLVFDTTEPHSMFDTAPPREGAAPRKNPVVPAGFSFHIYFHGDMEDKMGFDIAILRDGEIPTQTGEYDCLAGAEKALLVLWNSNRKVTSLMTGAELELINGLIVAPTDTKSLDYAREKSAERAFCL